MCVMYLIVITINREVFFGVKSKGTWQNYEGIVFYSLFTINISTLHLYCANKVKDCQEIIDKCQNKKMK